MSSQMTYFMLSAPMFPCGKDERICATKNSLKKSPQGDFNIHCSFYIVHCSLRVAPYCAQRLDKTPRI
jgi:hypothetical protein